LYFCTGLSAFLRIFLDNIEAEVGVCYPPSHPHCFLLFPVSDGLKMRPQYDGMMHCMKTIWKLEGIRGLYQGVTPNIWGAGASWGLYFLL